MFAIISPPFSHSFHIYLTFALRFLVILLSLPGTIWAADDALVDDLLKAMGISSIEELKSNPEIRAKLPELREKYFRVLTIKKSSRRAAVAQKAHDKKTVKKHDVPVQYVVIVENNLFRPLGSKAEVKQQLFTLDGIVTVGRRKIAIIERSDGTDIYFVSIGDTVAEGFTVARISEKEVQLANDKQELSLKLGGDILLGGSDNKRPTMEWAQKAFQKSRKAGKPESRQKIDSRDGSS